MPDVPVSSVPTIRVFVTHNPEDLDAYFGRALPALERIAHVVVNPLDRDLTNDELIAHADGCDVIVAHRSTPGPAELFEATPGLLAVLRTAVDVSTIDEPAASAAGVLIACADKSFVPSTAELALALILDVARGVSDSTVDYRRGVEPPQRPGFQLRGKTAGIVGYGAIGVYLADALRSLGVRVVVADPYVDASADGFRHCELDELLAMSDIVVPLAPANDETHHLIDERAIASMRPGTVLVNVSRGELLDERAVAAALDRGHLGGLGIDVGQAADQRPSLELARRTDVVATPHLGGLTPENADAQAMSAVEQVEAIIGGQIPSRAINPQAADRLRRWWSA